MAKAMGWAAAAAVSGLLLVVNTSAFAAQSYSGSAPVIRVNQVGYFVGSPKEAFLMRALPTSGVRFEVQSASGRVVFQGVSRSDGGSWNHRYTAVYALFFSKLSQAGRYRIIADGTHSPWFRIGSARALLSPLADNAVRYFTSMRDGPNVASSILNRRPANLTDQHAYVYATPRYNNNTQELVSKTLHKIAGPVNVAGGWFDAGGGYEKFTYTTSYADGLMLIAARDSGSAVSPLGVEAAYGLAWLKKMWNAPTRTLFIQVGIGNGNGTTIHGDYDFWFKPQAEDHMGVKLGSPDYYVEYRPVFEAAPPGRPISPDLAGRMAADFALGAQLYHRSNPQLAAYYLHQARILYSLAEVRNVRHIVTTLPYSYYPGTEWRSDMLWGAAEIALADEAMHAPRATVARDLAQAGLWARQYLSIGRRNGDTLNLYDTGAIAEAELLRAYQGTSAPKPVPPRVLLGDLASQLRLGESIASQAHDPFRLGAYLPWADEVPHALGLYVTNLLYRQFGGGPQFTTFADQQLNFALGANEFGSSFIVGAGTTYPRCMQSEIANLAGGPRPVLNPRRDQQLGAVVDGPSAVGNFQGLGVVPGMRACAAGSYRAFYGHGVGYEDNVTAWPSVEPSLDYTAISLIAFALGAGHTNALHAAAHR